MPHLVVTMSTVSAGTYIVQGLKFSLDILQDFSLDLPPPVSSVVNIVLRVVTIVEVWPRQSSAARTTS